MIDAPIAERRTADGAASSGDRGAFEAPGGGGSG